MPYNFDQINHAQQPKGSNGTGIKCNEKGQKEGQNGQQIDDAKKGKGIGLGSTLSNGKTQAQRILCGKDDVREKFEFLQARVPFGTQAFVCFQHNAGNAQNDQGVNKTFDSLLILLPKAHAAKYKKTPPKGGVLSGGPDGARTRDPMRDRHVF